MKPSQIPVLVLPKSQLKFPQPKGVSPKSESPQTLTKVKGDEQTWMDRPHIRFIGETGKEDSVDVETSFARSTGDNDGTSHCKLHRLSFRGTAHQWLSRFVILRSRCSQVFAALLETPDPKWAAPDHWTSSFSAIMSPGPLDLHSLCFATTTTAKSLDHESYIYIAARRDSGNPYMTTRVLIPFCFRRAGLVRYESEGV